MDRYKFGNNICRLREERGLTQEQFANMLGVTDKAVSKWENGQSIPRMETLESMALVLATPMEALIMAGKDDKTLLCITNDCCKVLHLDIDGKLLSIPFNESEWIEASPNGFTVNVKQYMGFEYFKQELKENDENITNFFEKIKFKFEGKVAEKFVKWMDESMLLVDCVYKCSGYKDGDVITVTADLLNLENRVSSWLTDALVMAYPLIQMKNGVATLDKVACSNRKEFIKRQKKLGLASDLGLGFLPMLVSYPIRGLYFKHISSSKTIMKNIRNADNLRIEYDNEAPTGKKGCGCLSFLLIIPICIILGFVLDFSMDMIFIDTEYPALVSSDYSQITYFDEVYTRIEKLPDNAYPELVLNYATIWEEARMDGLSRFDQVCSDNMVQLFADRQGNKYLWLVENYVDTVLTEDKEYDDFEEHYVYMLEAENQE